MKGLLSLLLWIPAGAALTACAGEETTGAFVAFTATFPFTPDARSYSQPLDVSGQEEIAAIAGQIACGGLDLAQSTLSVSGVEGADEAFTLSATLIDPQDGDEIGYFQWQGNFSTSARQVSFASDAVTLSDPGLDRVRQILEQREQKAFEVRYQLAADPMPDLVEITVVQHLRVATEAGTCP